MESVQDIRLCSGCKKKCAEPRSLPCFHSFCLKCLLQAIKGKNVKARKELSCPLCGREHDVRREGLRRNDFIYRQIKQDGKSSPSSKDKALCCICSKDKTPSDVEMVLATTYCIECEMEMCDRCNTEHSRRRSNSTHSVFGLGSQNITVDIQTEDTGNQCLEHPKKQMELYCRSCKAVICMTCFAETHKCHDCIDLDKHRDQLRNQMKKNCEKTTSCLNSCLTMRDRLESVERDFLKSADEAKVSIDERYEELKEMIDRHAEKLREELERAKKDKLKQISGHRVTLDRLIADLETFKAYCGELASKGTSVEIARDVAGVNERNTELQRLQEKQTGRQIGSMNFFFKSQELENYLRDMDNIVGSIEVSTSCDTECEDENRICLFADVWGVTKTGGCIYVLCRNLVYNSINVYSDREPHTLTREIKLKRIIFPMDLVSAETDDSLYVSDRAYACVWKISQRSLESKWIKKISWPFTMSMTSSGNLLILRSSQPSRLELYGPCGKLEDVFQLPAICQSPRHAVETSDGDFVVLHKFKDVKGSGKMVWNVSKVNSFGQIVRRFHPRVHPEMLIRPCHLALRYDNEVFVADPGRDGVAQLDSYLSWNAVFRVGTATRLQWPPRRLYYDAKEDTIIVGQKFGGVYIHKLDRD